MGEHFGRQHLHVIGQRVVAAAEDGVGLGGAIERLRSARADA